MRKKRRITKTAMVKTWFLLLAMTAVILTSCKDYDDDIDRLEEEIAALEATLGTANTDLATLKTQIAAAATDNEVTTAVNAAKTAAIAEAKTYVDGLLTTLRGGYTGSMDDLNDELTDIAAQLTALGVNVTGLTERLDAAEVQIAANKAAIELQQAVLDKYLADGAPDNLVDAINAVKDDLADLQASTTTDIDVLEAAVADLQEQINAINGGLNVLDFVAATNAMVTEVSFVYDYSTNYWDAEPSLDFNTAVARLTTTFGNPSWSSAISFTKDSRLIGDEDYVIVSVKPANADLSKMLDKIYLIDGKANSSVNDYVKVKSAERYTQLFTRGAPTTTGLWKITYELPATSNVAELAKLVVIPTTINPNLFAIAIENTVDPAETAVPRYVMSEYDVEISLGTIAPIYNDDNDPNVSFSVKKATVNTYTSYTDIRNRYAFTENAIPCNKDQKWEPGHWTATATTEDDPADDRTAKAFFGVASNEVFNVKLNNPSSVYAYYVTLDSNWAVESSPSEINAWNSYTYEGLNQVYMADEVANLKIASSLANGDIIGFRVYVVNFDGTLVDPDGKSFYTYVGDLASTAIAFEQQITTYIPDLVTAVPSTIVSFAPGVNLASVDTAIFNMTIGHSVVLDNTNLKLLDANNNVLGDATLTNWTNVKKLRIDGVVPSDLAENTTYNGTLVLKNSLGVPFSTTMVTFKKVLPAFDATITYKTNIFHDVNGAQVIYAYPLPPAGNRTYNLGNALNGLPTVPQLGAGFVVTNLSTYSSLPIWETTYTQGVIPQAEIGVPYLPNATGTNLHGKIFDLQLNKDFGFAMYNGSHCLIAWPASPAIKTEFRSFVQDLTAWQYTTAPSLKYATDATYAVSNVTALPPAGSRITMAQNEAAAGNLQDLRSFTITGVKLLTGSTFTIENEYFIPTFDPVAETISFSAVITSPPAGPVATKLQLTLTDDFNHAYVFTIDTTFNMVLN